MTHGRDAQALEHLSLEEARERLAESAAWTEAILRRLDPWLPAEGAPLRILDLGAAQGRTLIALAQLGHHPSGVEPVQEAIEAAHALAAEAGLELDIRLGVAEDLPFENDAFDVVIATSVLEHVDDLGRSLREVRRVLRPDGVFWFNSASAMCPRQSEIQRLPLFGWYPLRLKRRVMLWAIHSRPHLVGHTQKPALHWWTPWNARRRLLAAGFTAVYDRWELRNPAEARNNAEQAFVALARRSRLVRLLGDVIVPGCAYMATGKDRDAAAGRH